MTRRYRPLLEVHGLTYPQFACDLQLMLRDVAASLERAFDAAH